MASKTFTVTIAAAPSTGTPQYPTLLASYAHKPPFKVAGVDYYVGVPAGVTLKSPSAGLPVGATLSGSQVTVSGDNVTLDSYDFGSKGSIYVTGANCRIVNCKLVGTGAGGSQAAVISGRANNLYVGYSTIDGMGGAGGNAEFLVEQEGAGLVVENCWIRRSLSDIFGRHGNDGGSITIKNCLIEQAGMTQGTHGDYLQVYGPNLDSIVITGVTAIQKGGTTQGFFADNTKQGEIGNCVMIGDASYWVSTSGPNTKPGTFTGTGFSIHDNYFVLGGFGFIYGPSMTGPNQAKLTNNINMVTGGGP